MHYRHKPFLTRFAVFLCILLGIPFLSTPLTGFASKGHIDTESKNKQSEAYIAPLAFNPTSVNNLDDFIPDDTAVVRVGKSIALAGKQAEAIGDASIKQRIYSVPFATDEALAFKLNSNMLLYFEEGTFKEPVDIELSATHRSTPQTALALVEGQSGADMTQFSIDAISRETGEPTEDFQKAVRIVVDIRDMGIDLDDAGGNFYIAYQIADDPVEYVDVETAVHTTDGLLSADVTHFSNWAAGWRPESWALQFQPPAVSEFSGAVNYSYPIDTPPGRAGLTPSVALSYSSRAIDGLITSPETKPFADGWSVADISIRRVIEFDTGSHTDSLGVKHIYPILRHQNGFNLSINGSSHELIKVRGGNPVEYLVKDQPDMRVFRYFNNSQDSNNPITNEDGLAWRVDTADGKKYYLGYTADSEEWQYLTYNGSRNTVDGELALHGLYHHVNENEDGRDNDISVTAWYVNKITDTSDNQIIYRYHHPTTTSDFESERIGKDIYDKDVHLKTHTTRLYQIDYNFTGNTVGSRIEFRSRTDSLNPPAPHDDYIENIYVYHGGNLTNPLREYRIQASTHTIESASCANYNQPERTINRVIDGITLYTKTNNNPNDADSGAQLDTVQFNYSNKPHGWSKGPSRGECFYFKHLRSFSTFNGGTVVYDYKSDNRQQGEYHPGEHISSAGPSYPAVGHSYPVSKIRVYDGYKLISSTTYEYKDPCYSQWDGDAGKLNAPFANSFSATPIICSVATDAEQKLPKYGKLTGFGQTSVTLKDEQSGELLSRSVYQFNLNETIRGKTISSQSGYPHASNLFELDTSKPYSTNDYTYHTLRFSENDDGTYNGTFRPVHTHTALEHMNGQTIGTERKYTYDKNQQILGAILPVITWQLGQLTKLEEYTYNDSGSNELLRTTETKYELTSTNHWFIRPLHTTVTGADGTSTYTSYTHNRKGQLTQQRIDAPAEVGANHKILQTFTYDNYGNIQSQATYDDYEINGVMNGSPRTTTFGYDGIFHLYPISVTNPAGFTTEFEIYGFQNADGTVVNSNVGFTGQLKSVTDPNDLTTSYHYDDFGRLTRVFAPSDTNGSPRTQTVYHDDSYPFSIETIVKDDLLPRTRQYYDGLGRAFQTDQIGSTIETAPGQVQTDATITTLTAYDALNNPIRTTLPQQMSQTGIYQYDHANDSFAEYTGYRDNFNGLNTSEWGQGTNAAVYNTDQGVLELSTTGGQGRIDRLNETTAGDGLDDVIIFQFKVDFLSSHPNREDALAQNPRIWMGGDKGRWETDYLAFNIFMDGDNIKVLDWDDSRAQKGQYHTLFNELNLAQNGVQVANNTYHYGSVWYRAKITHSQSGALTIEVRERDNWSNVQSLTLNKTGRWLNDDWQYFFKTESPNATLTIDNYQERVPSSPISTTDTEYLYGYSNPTDGLIHIQDTQVKTPDGHTSTTNYALISGMSVNGDSNLRTQEITDANGEKITYFYNSIGQLVQTREHTAQGAGDYADTIYHYDDFGQLTRIDRKTPTDHGHGAATIPSTTITYNSLGQKTSMIDPDMGEWEYKYDALGNLIEQIDGNGQHLCFYYDVLNRLVLKTQSNTSCPTQTEAPTSGENWLATYTYDSAVTYNGTTYGGKNGLLTKVSWGPNGDQNFELFQYDQYTRLTKHTRVIEGIPYTMSYYDFDDLDRPQAVRYPDSEIVRMTYDTEGENTLTVDGVQIVDEVLYNERGQMTYISRTHTADTRYTYNQTNGRLTQIQHDGTGLSTYNYTYDNVGNILTLEETVGSNNQTQTFTYDHLYRLHTASAPTVGDLPGYDLTYEYNEVGNILYRNQDGQQLVYNYDWTQPHAVDSSTDGWNYTYDDNGNMTQRNGPTDTYLQGFDAENRLTSVEKNGTETTTFYYDASGQRTMTVEPNGTKIHYPFSNYEAEYPVAIQPTMSLIAINEADNIQSEEKLVLKQNDSFRLTWSTTQLSNCVASNAWTGNQLDSGSSIFTANNVGTHTYTLTCETSAGASMSQSVNIEVIPSYTRVTFMQEQLPDGTLVELTPTQTDWEFQNFTMLEEGNSTTLWLSNNINTPGQREGVEQRLQSSDGLIWHARTDTNLVDNTPDYKKPQGLRQVIYDGTTYHGWQSQYYYVTSGMWTTGLRYVTSTDGLSWTVVTDPVLTSGGFFSVIHEDDTYKMWVSVAGDTPYTGTRAVRYRTSTSPGSNWGHWQTGGTAINVDGAEIAGQTRVRRLADGSYQLFFYRIWQGDTMQLSMATSTDGVNFTMAVPNLVDFATLLPDYHALRDFVVHTVNGEDWFYFTYRDTNNQSHFAVIHPEEAIQAITGYDFEGYNTGQDLGGQDGWVKNQTCNITVENDNGNNIIRSGSCGNGQSAKRAHTFGFTNQMDNAIVQFKGRITSGSGNNSNATVGFRSDTETVRFGITNNPSQSINHQLFIYTPSTGVINGTALTPGVWYDFRLNIDWTHQSSGGGYGLATLYYRPSGTQTWLPEPVMTNIELGFSDVSAINQLDLRMDGASNRRGEVDDILIAHEGDLLATIQLTPTPTATSVPPTSTPTATAVPPTATAVSSGILSVSLIDAESDTVVQVLPLNTVTQINRADYPGGINLAINTTADVASIRYDHTITPHNGSSWTQDSTSNGAPYAYCSLTGTDYADCADSYFLIAGHTYDITFNPFDSTWGTGQAFPPVSLTLEIVDDAGASTSNTSVVAYEGNGDGQLGNNDQQTMMGQTGKAPQILSKPANQSDNTLSGLVQALKSTWVLQAGAQLFLIEVDGEQETLIQQSVSNVGRPSYTFEVNPPNASVTYKIVACYADEEGVYVGTRANLTAPNLFANVNMVNNADGCPYQQPIVRKTYLLAGQPIATKVQNSLNPDTNGLFYVHTDHLGSASTVTNDSGTVLDSQRFLPFGEARTESSTDITDRGFTGHLHNDDIGLVYMNARFYVPGIGRFASADTIVPDPLSPQQFNRYTYVLNNPIKLVDPSGHCAGSSMTANGQRNLEDECWAYIWAIWGDWGRNGNWEQIYGDLDTFWELAHDENLDATYWKSMFDNYYGLSRPAGDNEMSSFTGYGGISDDLGSPIRGLNPHDNPDRFCHREPCEDMYETNITISAGPVSFSNRDGFSIAPSAGIAKCTLGACYGKEASIPIVDRDILNGEPSTIEVSTTKGVGVYGQLANIEGGVMGGVRQTSGQQEVEMFAAVSVAIFTIEISSTMR